MDVGAAEEWTAKDVVAHVGWASENGYIAKATASAMATSVKKILEYTHGEEWATVDIRALDLEDLLPRFENLSKRDLSGQSMQTYEGRFLKALDSYRLHQEDPKGWSSAMQAKARRTAPAKKPGGDGNEDGPNQTRTATGGSTKPSAQEARPISPDLVAYPFPIRQGVIAYMHLPADLRPKEATRLKSFLDSLAIDEAGE